ncbi:MAG TPA: hypothetical protein VGP47_10715, partial [Parachlamydiaceae bacterium]|nr:hypothetical protein [Parachlamydiaceae bacterium]
GLATSFLAGGDTLGACKVVLGTQHPVYISRLLSLYPLNGSPILCGISTSRHLTERWTSHTHSIPRHQTR